MLKHRNMCEPDVCNNICVKQRIFPQHHMYLFIWCLSIYYDIHLYIDSSAAMGMVARKGMDKSRHIEVSELWIQDAVRNKVLTVNKVKGDDNPSVILTKYIEQGKIHQHCHGMRLVPEGGRPDSAPATTS